MALPAGPQAHDPAKADLQTRRGHTQALSVLLGEYPAGHRDASGDQFFVRQWALFSASICR
jgi:hypothetical protein